MPTCKTKRALGTIKKARTNVRAFPPWNIPSKEVTNSPTAILARFTAIVLVYLRIYGIFLQIVSLVSLCEVQSPGYNCEVAILIAKTPLIPLFLLFLLV